MSVVSNDLLRWTLPQMEHAKEWHLTFDGANTLCDQSLGRALIRRLSGGPPSRICAACQKEIKEQLGLT